MRPGAAGGERGPDQEHRVLPELVCPGRLGQRADGALQEPLVRPGHPVGHHHRRFRGVPAVQQFLLELPGARGGQEHGHRAAVPREVGDLLAGERRGLAAAEPGEDHRLGHLGDGELPARDGGGRGVGADARDGLVRQTELVAEFPLFLHRSPQRRVAGVYAGHDQLLSQRALVQPAHALQRQPGGIHQLRTGPGLGEHVGVDQARGPHHHVGAADDPGGAQGEQVGGTGPGPDEPDLGAGRGPRPRVPGRAAAPQASGPAARSAAPRVARRAGHGFPPRIARRAGMSSVDRYGAGPVTSAAGRMSSPGSPRLAPCTAPSRRPASRTAASTSGRFRPLL